MDFDLIYTKIASGLEDFLQGHSTAEELHKAVGHRCVKFAAAAYNTPYQPLAEDISLACNVLMSFADDMKVVDCDPRLVEISKSILKKADKYYVKLRNGVGTYEEVPETEILYSLNDEDIWGDCVHYVEIHRANFVEAALVLCGEENREALEYLIDEHTQE